MLERGKVITIPPGDRLGATDPTRLLLTRTPGELLPQQEWVVICGVELDEHGYTLDLPISVTVRAALLRELGHGYAERSDRS